VSELWIPATVSELETAVEAGTLVETHFQEYKQFGRSANGVARVPPSLAKSLAGLAVDGGVLVVGIAENKEAQRFELDPRPLLGLRDAVDQVALQALSPSLRVTVRELVRDDGTGYLVIIVPASPRAPHMVDGRYYGRGDASSRPLTDIEVRALWGRHLDRRDHISDLISTEIEREPVPVEDRTNARLFVVAQPVSADPRLLLDSVPDRDLLRWVQGLNDTPLYQRGRQYRPSFAHEGGGQRRAHGVARTTYYLDSDRTVRIEPDGQKPRHSSIVDMEYREDGGLRLYYGRASDTRSDGEWLLLNAIAGETAGVIEAARLVSSTAGFHGSWRFGVALRGIRGISALNDERSFFDGWKFSEDRYDEAAEADYTALVEPGSPVVDALLGRLVRSTKGPTEDIAAMDPFAISSESVHP
jgi:hypothetical protein